MLNVALHNTTLYGNTIKPIQCSYHQIIYRERYYPENYSINALYSSDLKSSWFI
jgi:hypothetical protein